MIGQSVIPLLSCCWPGVAGVWRKGDLHSLLVSLLFGLLVNTAFLGTFLWPEWISGWALVAMWIGICIGAIGACLQTLWFGGRHPAHETLEQRTRLLVGAQEYYLQGNYFEAEQSLRKSLLSNEEDIDAALLMVSVLRRTGRYSEALEWIHRMMRLDVAARLETEFLDEKQRCLRGQIGTPPAHD